MHTPCVNHLTRCKEVFDEVTPPSLSLGKKTLHEPSVWLVCRRPASRSVLMSNQSSSSVVLQDQPRLPKWVNAAPEELQRLVVEKQRSQVHCPLPHRSIAGTHSCTAVRE